MQPDRKLVLLLQLYQKSPAIVGFGSAEAESPRPTSPSVAAALLGTVSFVEDQLPPTACPASSSIPVVAPRTRSQMTRPLSSTTAVLGSHDDRLLRQCQDTNSIVVGKLVLARLLQQLLEGVGSERVAVEAERYCAATVVAAVATLLASCVAAAAGLVLPWLLLLDSHRRSSVIEQARAPDTLDCSLRCLQHPRMCST